MRLFQNSGLYPSYRRCFDRKHRVEKSFDARLDSFLKDRFGALHFLNPVLNRDPCTFFTNGDDEQLQWAWARENGLKENTSLYDILLAQIEHHNTEVFYNLDPIRYGRDFLRRLPGCVRHTLAWRAAPPLTADLGEYGRLLCNFPKILEMYRNNGWAEAYFAPAHDKVMDDYASRNERPIDILFVGGFSRHHAQRVEMLEVAASFSSKYSVQFHLDQSRLTRLAESFVGRFILPRQLRRPVLIQRVSAGPIFGLELYETLSKAKIVLNGAIDMAGQDRGNMRCFEAMGCGALLVSDDGIYPEGMTNHTTMLTYRNREEVSSLLTEVLQNWQFYRKVANNGNLMVKENYSKEKQWHEFQRIVGEM